MSGIPSSVTLPTRSTMYCGRVKLIIVSNRNCFVTAIQSNAYTSDTPALKINQSIVRPLLISTLQSWEYRASNRVQKFSTFCMEHKSKSSISRRSVRSGKYERSFLTAPSALERDRQARIIRIRSSCSAVLPGVRGATPSNILWAIFNPSTLTVNLYALEVAIYPFAPVMTAMRLRSPRPSTSPKAMASLAHCGLTRLTRWSVVGGGWLGIGQGHSAVWCGNPGIRAGAAFF
jgi:hypothetical protein